MQSESALLWWSLGILNRKRYELLLERFGSLDDALGHLSPEFLKELGLREETIRSIVDRLESFDPAPVLATMGRLQMGLLTIEDDTYPDILRQTPDAPVFMSYRGDTLLLKELLVALVGTRQITQYGRQVTESFTEAIARSGIPTVSGLALGVDALVAKETLRAGGRHIAVLAHGLSTIYPRANVELAEEILAHGGLILSEYAIDQEPQMHHFPARNRIIAGLSKATVILEAPAESGAIITGELALDYNREVFAVPGQVNDLHFEGCNRLIAEGTARLVRSGTEVLSLLGMIASEERSTYIPTSALEESILKALSSLPQSVDDLLIKTALSPAELSSTLTILELHDAVKNVGGTQWVRC